MLTLSRNNTGELVIRWLLLSASVWVAAEIVDGIEIEGWESILAVGAILGLLNLYVRPVLMTLALPLTIITLGLFIVVINALMLGAADWVADQIEEIHFAVESVGAALLGALVISLVNIVLESIVRPTRLL